MRFTRAIQQRNLWAAETAIREMGNASLLLLIDYLALLTEVKPEKFPLAALRWHGRLELEATMLTLADSHLALAALVAMGEGNREALEVLRGLLRRVRPTLLPRVS